MHDRIFWSVWFKIKKQIKLSLYVKKYPVTIPPNVCHLILRSGPNEASQVDYGVKLPERPTEARLRLGLTSFQGQLVSNARPEPGDKAQSRMGGIISLNFAPEYWDLKIIWFSKCGSSHFPLISSQILFIMHIWSLVMFKKGTGKLEQLTGYQAYLLHTRQVFILLIRADISCEVLRAQYGGNPLRFMVVSFRIKNKGGWSFQSIQPSPPRACV